MAEYLDRSSNIGEFVAMPGDNMIICRCEEITKGEIRKAIYDGMWTMTEIKRYTRAGMGLCQGQTCSRMIKGMIAKELGAIPLSIADNTARVPVRPVEMKVYGKGINKVKRKYKK